MLQDSLVEQSSQVTCSPQNCQDIYTCYYFLDDLSTLKVCVCCWTRSEHSLVLWCIFTCLALLGHPTKR